MATAFDHAVIMVRDQLDTLAPDYVAQGYRLSARAQHNIGSCNQLIVLQDAYIELLGWPPGTPPRPEIAASQLGLEALVFRSDDASATHARLQAAGLAVLPVHELNRPAQLVDATGGEAGETTEAPIARFQTVRFAEQPIPGLRMYFCQHLTPHYVWQPGLMAHPNGAQRIVHIDLAAPEARDLAERLGAIIEVAPEHAHDHSRLLLTNLTLRIWPEAGLALPRLSGLSVRDAYGAEQALRIASEAASDASGATKDATC